MYLSKVLINGTACRNPYEIHRVLWKLFPEDADAERDFLFRVERAGQQSVEVLMLSRREPATAGARDVRLMGSKPYILSLQQDQRLRFMLVANPVKTINDESARLNSANEIKKCRVPLIREEDLRAWLRRKLESVAVVEAVKVEKRPAMNFRKTREKRVGKVQAVSFHGVLSVTDSAGLISLINTGIGPAKAFGCGLLSLART